MMFSVVTKYHKGRHSLFLYNSEIFYAFTQDILRSPSVGVILNQSQLKNRRQELLARRLAYKAIISIDDLIHCYNLGLQSNYEVAEELELPEGFVLNAINYFKTQLTDGDIYKGYRIHTTGPLSFTKVPGKALSL
ncbi:hypothetical protein [Levilactobacillus namurensis]|uniref:hypothetical protein n=1 Tax=Levilactobacillus namurensis TaxID=380393 RepID=UPI002231EFC4|nr:hypothetical protein [Levilactobacillus namurensis]WNN65816.1 hypothetical protein RIN67_01615 [Levilactobacillus namurensis]